LQSLIAKPGCKAWLQGLRARIQTGVIFVFCALAFRKGFGGGLIAGRRRSKTAG
jgi:hypothetical protein